MATILEEITARKRHDLQSVMEKVPARQLYNRVERLMETGGHHRSLAEALRKSPTGIIAEFKRKSPSKGWIHREARPEDIVPAYARAGAAGLSILTDEPYFGGCNAFVETVRPLVEQPILRKDFTIDEYSYAPLPLGQVVGPMVNISGRRRIENETHPVDVELLGQSDVDGIAHATYFYNHASSS